MIRRERDAFRDTTLLLKIEPVVHYCCDDAGLGFKHKRAPIKGCLNEIGLRSGGGAVEELL